MKKKPLSLEGQLFQTLLLAEAENSFGSTEKLNKDVVKLALLNPNFLNDIEKIREEFNIPKLKYDDDRELISLVTQNDSGSDIEISKWIERLIPAKRKRFYKRIEDLVSKYSFPINFNDWLEAYVLYGKPEFIPKFPYAWLVDALKYEPNKLRKVRLTTEEKQLLTEYFRDKLGLKTKGRTSKKLSKVYEYFQEILNSTDNKNKHRRLKNINIASTVIKQKGKKAIGRSSKDPRLEEIYFKRYFDLVAEIWPDVKDISVRADTKRAQKLRKVKQRLKGAVNKMKK